MKKIERRAGLCLLLAAALVLGLAIFGFRFVFKGSTWVSFPSNRHLYNDKGQLAVGNVLDRDGDVLTEINEDGNRVYYDSETVRKATLHAVGDPSGNIATGALTAFADKLSGYNFVTGAYSPLGTGNNLYLTLDARLNYEAYKALGSNKGAVGVYNYKTGEVLCMVSTPTFDPLNPPEIKEGDEKYEGVYLNRFLSSSFTPGSVFKTVTLTAALEKLPGVESRHFTCTGKTRVGDGIVTCPSAHGEMTLADALAKSCNGAFALLSAELGDANMKAYTEKAGLAASYSVNGIQTAKGSFAFDGASENELGWAGIGQHNDQVNPCALMVYMGAIANGGRAAIPQLVLKNTTSFGMPLSFYMKKSTGKLIEEDTAAKVAEMMANNVTETYGNDRFPNMEICAKSGTAEVGGDKKPNAWFAGFLQGRDTPYAFVVMVENGGGGNKVAGTVAGKVLTALVN